MYSAQNVALSIEFVEIKNTMLTLHNIKQGHARFGMDAVFWIQKYFIWFFTLDVA